MHLKNRFLNILLPSVGFGMVTGFFTAVVILIYKFIAKHFFELSAQGYEFLRSRLYLLPVVAVVLLCVSLTLAYIFKKAPDLLGGGIPTSIIVLRGFITFKWLRNLIGIFCLSLTSFLLGVPLGNEGPSVLMGTAIGKGTMYLFPKKYAGWSRFSMTGGACAGFSVATGAPISGIMFAVEEAHQRISPTIITVSTISVISANVTAEILSPFFKISTNLFPGIEIVDLSIRHLPLCGIIGIAMGLFASLFLNYYRAVKFFFKKALCKVPLFIRIFIIFALTAVMGLISQNFISTGHEVITYLFEEKFSLLTLVIILLVRCTLTLSANTNKITGGTFIPLLTVGALFSALMAGLIEKSFSLPHELYTVMLAMGMAACIASLMKMPITAITFAIEALGCNRNILHLIIICALAYVVTEMFGVKSINDMVIEDRVSDFAKKHPPKLIDTEIEVEKGSFATGKEIRDIFWPAGLFVLSVTHKDDSLSHREGNALHEGDVLHIRYTTSDEAVSRKELDVIVKAPTNIK